MWVECGKTIPGCCPKPALGPHCGYAGDDPRSRRRYASASLTGCQRPIEVCASYVVSEKLTDAAKHAQATAIRLHASMDGGQLHVSVRADGIGGMNTAGAAIIGLRNRVEALGGTFAVDSDHGRNCRHLPAADRGPITTILVTIKHDSSTSKLIGRYRSLK